MTAVTPPNRLTTPTLRSLVVAAYLADPSDQLISPVGERSYSTLFGLIPSALTVLRMAAEIEPDPPTLMAWYLWTPIAELGFLTAEPLVDLDREETIFAFLDAIQSGARD
jgi:hypothetical protein